ncbi:protein MAIN-LIKE 2-like [Papaver somniferum]|uniref:protein MAIN-LIKE 2-like n=1 Tax=Papaver somniferum TaxID=3469 RepID=UPI000E6F56F9|nr:protein MAIN-LIKE 2-like [Papaver somniferum]
MTITPDDVKQITDLEVEGQLVFEGFNNNMAWTDLYALLEETLGWGKDETEMEFKLVGGYDPNEPHKPKNPLKKLMLKNLRKKFKGTFKREKEGEVIDEITFKRTATSYLLYSLGTVFFPDNSGNRVNVHYLQLLKNLDNIKNYSWATATLAYLLDSLRKASRVGATEIAGNVAILMAWVYHHFPSLEPPTNWEPHDYVPTGKKFMFTGRQQRFKDNKLIRMREKIDAFTVEDFIFDPYVRIHNGVDARRFTETAGYNGPLYHPTCYVMTNPRRILRQIGHIQVRAIKENFKLSKEGSETKGPTIVLNYRPTPTVDAWNNRHEERYQLAVGEAIPCINTKEAAADYMTWYTYFGHPYVINNDLEAQQTILKAVAQMKEVHETKEKTGLFGLSWKKLYFISKERGQALANNMISCIRSNDVIKAPQQKILQEQIRNLHNPNMEEFYEGLVMEERGSKRSRNSLGGVISSRRQPSPGSEETNDEEEEGGGP